MRSSRIVTLLIILNIIRLKGQEEFTCGRRKVNHKGLIINGFPSNEGDWPWHAALYYIGNDQQTSYVCGGSLISLSSVLTAAHCVYTNDKTIRPEKVLVRLGKHKLTVSGANSQEFQAYKIISHPDYSTEDLSNDIAIIKLSTEATLTDYVQPICLWDSKKVDLSHVIGKLGTVIGWGITQTDELSNILQYAVIPVIPSLTCLMSNRAHFGRYLSDKNFCAGFPNGTGACNGDSGGSISFKENGVYYIRGIVSLAVSREDNFELCDSKNYVLFTDVAQYLSWIEKVVPQLKRTEPELDKCEKEVNCCVIEDYETGLKCKVQIQLESSEENCNIIFKEATNTNVIVLTLTGKMDAIPDLSNALQIFENIEYLDVGFLEIKRVDRNRLAIVKQITWLSFYGNRISEFSADTFDDLKQIKKLLLAANRLKNIHRDLFKELENLTQIWLQKNQIEILPEGLFRNNHKLKEVFAGENKLKIIRIDFFNLPVLSEIDLRKNKCIDEYCSVSNFCQTNSIGDMQSKIWDKC